MLRAAHPLFSPSPASQAEPAGEPAPYSAAERERLRAAFAPVVAAYRRYKQLTMVGIGLFLAGLVLPLVLPDGFGGWLWPLPVIGFPLAGYATFRAVRLLKCPGCAQALEGKLGPYCPECGARELQAGDWLRPSVCGACGKHFKLEAKRARAYLIRACTHCGLRLDEAGL